EVAAGAAPAEAYGFFALRDRRVDVDAVDGSLPSHPVWRLASQAFQRFYVIPRSGMGYRLHQASSIRSYLRADPRRWIIATTDSIALPLLGLKRRGRLEN